MVRKIGLRESAIMSAMSIKFVTAICGDCKPKIARRIREAGAEEAINEACSGDLVCDRCMEKIKFLVNKYQKLLRRFKEVGEDETDKENNQNV